LKPQGFGPFSLVPRCLSALDPQKPAPQNNSAALVL
jgi:hypothetical protein